MKNDKVMDAVTARYDTLAESSCCLSCGGAADRAGVRPGDTCVDLGSGRGTDTLRLAEQTGPDGFAYGIDVSPAMIEKAKKTAERLGVTNVAFFQSGLNVLPLESASVDCVVSNCAINHVSNKDAVWSEIRRILKPGGRFVVSDIYATDTVPEEFHNDPEKVAQCWAGAQTRDEYLKTVSRAGFVSVNILEESEPYSKGEITVSSLTLVGTKPSACGCCGGDNQ
jgi:ubiquinone/menaquinone biosynthesis C-methylase UbiE